MKKPADFFLWFFFLYSVFFLTSCSGKTVPVIFYGTEKISLEAALSGNSIKYRFVKKPFIHLESDFLYLSAVFSPPGHGYIFTIETSSGKLTEIPLIFEDGKKTAVYFPLPRGIEITGFDIYPPENTEIQLIKDNPFLLSISAEGNDFNENRLQSFTRGAGVLFYGQDIRFSSPEDVLYSRIDFHGKGMPVIGVRLKDGVPGSGANNGDVLFRFYTGNPEDSDNSFYSTFLAARTVRNKIILNPADMQGFEKSSGVEISFPGLSLKDVIDISIEYNTVEKKTSALSPLSADLGTILRRPMETWRFSNYELYSWTLYPEILIIDTADYAFQNSMFKRLVYFIEKPLISGTLLDNSELRKNNSWNAHDYSADSLADFFNTADREKFRLNPEEDLLKAILIDNNIIVYKTDRYKPAGGGILAISQNAAPGLRDLLLRHEGYHGIYYASEEFHSRCREIWDRTDSRIKTFWKLLLKTKTYDDQNTDLAVKEFKGYSLQQPVEDAEAYFFNIVLPGLLRTYPEEKPLLEDIAGELKEEFLENVIQLEEALFEITGLRAGNLVFVRETESL